MESKKHPHANHWEIALKAANAQARVERTHSAKVERENLDLRQENADLVKSLAEAGKLISELRHDLARISGRD